MELTLKALTKFYEDWKAPDDFYISFHADIGPKNIDGSDLFTFDVASPKRLESIISKRNIELGHGYLIMNDFDLQLVIKTVNNLIKSSQNKDIEKSLNYLAKYFEWEMDTI